MKLGSKQFYEVMDQFEKNLESSNVYGHRVERVKPKLREGYKGQFYHDGTINQLFKFFMSGFEFAKFLARQNDLDFRS